MSKHAPTLFQTHRALPRAAFLARALLHAAVLLVMSVFPCTPPGLELLNVAESEAPFDQDQSSEEEAISVHARARVGRGQPGWPLLVPVRGGLSLVTAEVATAPRSGHRLPNDLLAPLRC